MLMRLGSYEKMLERLRPGPLLDLLIHQAPDAAFFIKDRDGRFVTGNQALIRILGATSIRDIEGLTDTAFTADFLAEAFRADDRLVLEKGRTIRDKVELVPTPDTLEWRRTTKIPLHDHEGRIIGLAGTTRAINDSDEAYRDHPEMRAIVAYIQSHFQEGVTKAAMARSARVSLSTVERLFRKTFGITPGQYARKIRLNAACQMLRTTSIPLQKIAAACGFFDQTSMTHAFRSEINITPARYRDHFRNTNHAAAAADPAAPANTRERPHERKKNPRAAARPRRVRSSARC